MIYKGTKIENCLQCPNMELRDEIDDKHYYCIPATRYIFALVAYGGRNNSVPSWCPLNKKEK